MKSRLNYEILEKRLEGVNDAQTRARVSFFVLLVATVSILVALWNAYLSWDRQWADSEFAPKEWGQTQVTSQTIKSWTEGLAILPFAIFGGLTFTIPYALTGVFLGPEFPSLIGALVGLPIVILAAKSGFLVPKKTWDFAPMEKWPSSWMSKFEMKFDAMTSKVPMSLTKAWIPYILVAIVLVITRVSPEVKSFISSFAIS